MILLQHRATTGAGIHPVSGSCTLSWRKNQSVMAGVVDSIRVRAAGFERAEDPM
jgi:hypothetical protein